MKKREKQMEEVGVFVLTRTKPTEVSATNVFVTEVKKEDWKKPEVQTAMAEELRKWEHYNAYELIEDVGQEKIAQPKPKHSEAKGLVSLIKPILSTLLYSTLSLSTLDLSRQFIQPELRQ